MPTPEAPTTSIIGGTPAPSDAHPFRAIDPLTSGDLPGLHFAASAQDVDRAARLAAEAFAPSPGLRRAALLRAVAGEIDQDAGAIIASGMAETALPEPRLRAELSRTLGQLRMFAQSAERGDFVRAVIDHGDASRQPLPRPDLRRMLRPLGPVAVFGAGNFPLAYSTAGGDTASALAAGCPVIVKGHPGHPRTGALTAAAVARAVRTQGEHPGTFAYLHAGGARELPIGRELVQHPAVRAVGFTGSFKGGMTLHTLASERPEPVPVFAEMGSTNPVVVLSGAIAARSAEIASKLAASITASTGQMCTCPGVVLVPAGGRAFADEIAKAVSALPLAPMLSPRVRQNFEGRLAEVQAALGQSGPVLITDSATFRSRSTTHEEIFGPAAIIVECPAEADMVACLRALRGTLTATLWSEPGDAPAAGRLMSELERLAGRVIHNGVPTGVEVTAAMVHGGPFPATNQPQTSAVGALAIERWCRPVCYQNAPESMLPIELQEANPLGIAREVDGVFVPRRA